MVMFVDKPARSDDYRRSLYKDESRDDEIESKNALLMEEYNIDEAQPVSSKINEQVGTASSVSSVCDVDTENNSDSDTNNHDHLHRRNDSIITSASANIIIESERLDISKFILVLLVIIGHFIEPYYKLGNRLAWTLMHLIYSFHIPAFVCISGYTTSGDYFSTKYRRRKLISRLLIPYLILQPLFCLWYGVIVQGNATVEQEEKESGVSSSVDGSMMMMEFTPNWILYNQQPWSYFYPFAHLWYLISLFTMRIWSSFALEVRYTLVIHILFGCLIGYSANIGRFLSLHRTIVFMPYFLCGCIMRQKQCFFPYATSTQSRIILLVTILMLCGAAFLATSLNLTVEIWFQSDPHAAVYKDYSMYGGFFQLACYVWTTMAMTVFSALIPPPSTCGVKYTAVATITTDSCAVELGTEAEESTSLSKHGASWRCCDTTVKKRKRPGQAAENEQESVLARVYLRFAKWGQRSLYAYVLHMAVLMILVQFGYYNNLWSIVDTEISPLRVIGTVTLACALTIGLLLRPFFPTYFRCLLEPDMDHVIFQREQEDVGFDVDVSAVLVTDSINDASTGKEVEVEDSLLK